MMKGAAACSPFTFDLLSPDGGGAHQQHLKRGKALSCKDGSVAKIEYKKTPMIPRSFPQDFVAITPQTTTYSVFPLDKGLDRS
jgi:hypothetical protein